MFVSIVPLMDAQRAMGLARANARTLGFDANTLGFIGFSAGGHLTAHLSASSSANMSGGSASRRAYKKGDEADDERND